MSEFTKDDQMKGAEEVKDDDSLFPEFLWIPIFNEFDDSEEFYQAIETEYSDIQSVLKLKRKYRDYFKWRAAMEVYENYMDFLAEKYGSMSIIQNSIEEGIPLEDFIPSKPKLKRTYENKMIMKTGIMPSRRVISKMDPERLRELSDLMYGEVVIHPEDHYPTTSKDKRATKMFNKAVEEEESVQRIKNLKVSKQYPGTDIIQDFYNRMQNNYDQYGRRRDERYTDESISETVERLLDEEYKDPEIAAYEESLIINPIVTRNNTQVRKERADQLDIMKAMLSEGYGLEMLSGSNMDKRAVKMLKMQMGVDQSISTEDLRSMSKKERKKAKKRLKKQHRQSRINDENINAILARNKISDDIDNINFRINNLFTK